MEGRSASLRMVGESPAMRRVWDFVRRVAGTNSTILISGESGTGKELVARAIVRGSSRADKPFVAMNCAAVPETLFEAELFGYERGAFTGAVAARKGKLERAHGGTLFLDEITEMALPLQSKLLRVLQEHECERIGAARPVALDVRVIASTNRNTWEAVKQGSLREDLFFRLNVIAIELPPLRERGHDIHLLADHFAATLAGRLQRPVPLISGCAHARLLGHSWPGNVRELQNVIERAIVLGSGESLSADDLGPFFSEAAAPSACIPTLHHAVRAAKRSLIVRALEQTAGNRTEAALLLGIHPKHLSRLLATLNLRQAN